MKRSPQDITRLHQSTEGSSPSVLVIFIMLSDRTKLLLLGACLFGSLSTLWTSSSFMMGRNDLGVIGAPPNTFCKEPRAAAEACLDKEEEDSSCLTLLSQASKCEETLKRAYRHINMGGCPREIQAVTICEVEWCEDVGGNREAEKACSQECSTVRETLDKCVQGHVSSFFQRYGLEENGTIKIK